MILSLSLNPISSIRTELGRKRRQPLNQKKNKRYFSLLEIMVALLLITIASGVIGLKMQKGVARKQFQSQAARLKERLFIVQKMALATQSDWKSILTKDANGWLVEIVCEEREGKKISPLRLSSLQIKFNRKKVNKLVIDFYATGKVAPEGELLLFEKEEKIKWNLNTLFSRDEGDRQGPLQPSLRK